MSGVLAWLGVAALGSAGALARFALDGAISQRSGTRFPLGTLAVNASGALLLGVLWGASLAGEGYLLAGTAFLGSYTTFSTWMLESHRLSEEGSLRAAAANVILSLGIGLAFVALGHWIGGLL